MVFLFTQVYPVHNGDPPCGMGATPDLHQPHHQRGGEPDPHQGFQGYQPRAAHRVPFLLQSLRQEQVKHL